MQFSQAICPVMGDNSALYARFRYAGGRPCSSRDVATIRFVEDDEGKKQVVPPNKARRTCGAQVYVMMHDQP